MGLSKSGGKTRILAFELSDLLFQIADPFFELNDSVLKYAMRLRFASLKTIRSAEHKQSKGDDRGGVDREVKGGTYELGRSLLWPLVVDALHLGF